MFFVLLCICIRRISEDDTDRVCGFTQSVVCELADFARQLTKQALRKPVVERLAARQDEEAENVVNFLTTDSVQRALGCYLESLRKPKH